jgi:DNA-binding MarR family transcriptional regulator
MVNEAMDSGWVERLDNPAHRRSVLMALTHEDRSAIDIVLSREHELMARTPGRLTDEDIDTTLRVLAAMRSALDAMDTPEPDPGRPLD